MAYEGSCRGVVEQVKRGKALVALSGDEACAACKAEGSCGLSGTRKGRSVWVLDTLGAEPGDAVKVELSDEGILAASFVLYGIPLGGLLLGALVGQACGGENRSIVGAAVGLVASIPVVRLMANKIPEQSRFAARIVASESPRQDA